MGAETGDRSRARRGLLKPRLRLVHVECLERIDKPVDLVTISPRVKLEDERLIVVGEVNLDPARPCRVSHVDHVGGWRLTAAPADLPWTLQAPIRHSSRPIVDSVADTMPPNAATVTRTNTAML